MSFYIMPEYAPSSNGMYVFEKDAEINEAGDFDINIFAASRYILYVNGTYVCEGPCRSHDKVRYYDSVSCRLEKGINKIFVKVMYTTDYFTSVHNTARPMLIFEARSGNVTIESDKSWTCRYLKGYKLVPFEMFSLPPFEIFDARSEDLPLAVVEEYPNAFRERGDYSPYGSVLPFVLEKRPIPMIYPGEKYDVKLIRSGEGFAEYDAGRYITAKVSFKIAKNSKVKIIYSECYESENGKGKRDAVGSYLRGYSDTVATAEENITYEPFWFRAFRFIRIEGDVSSVSEISAHFCHYPYEVSGNFECSESKYNEMFEVSKHTLYCCSHEIIVDCPYYEQQQYEMDSLIELSTIYRLTNDRSLAKKCINEFRHSQMSDGHLWSVYPSTYTQIIPSYSLFWVMMVRDYLDDSADTEFVSGLVGNIDAVLGCFDRKCSRMGLVIPSDIHWDFVDWVPAWDRGTVPLESDEAHTIYSMYYAKALLDGAYICEKLGRNGLASEYRQRYNKLADNIENLCYDSERGLYKNGSKTREFSMHTIIWSILAGLVSNERADEMLKKMSDPDLYKSSFSMNFFLFRALEKCERYNDLAFDLFDGWKKMLDNNCTTWCENPDFPRSECHAWSGAPLYEMSSNVLGVKISFDDCIVISPKIGKLYWARGCVPGRFGDIHIIWRIEDRKFSIKIDSPEGTNKKLVLPNGENISFSDASFEAFCSI